MCKVPHPSRQPQPSHPWVNSAQTFQQEEDHRPNKIHKQFTQILLENLFRNEPK